MPRQITSGRVLVALAICAGGVTAAAPAVADDPANDRSSRSHPGAERLVVRGQDTLVDGPCDAGVCAIRVADGTFRGTPVGTGAYDGHFRLAISDGFGNGEGGVCAPVAGRLTLGGGTPNRLVVRLSGDSCQDGAGDPTSASFTLVARFRIVAGTGTYARARGRGLATSVEDATDRSRLTLIGTLHR